MKFYRQSTVSKKTLKDILSKNNNDYSEDEKKKIIEEIFEIDPDKKNHKNSVWLARQYLITNGDLPENLTTLLKTFNTLCDNNRIKDKELKNYKSIEDLRDVVSSAAEKGISRRDELAKREKEGLKEIDRLGEFVLYYATDYDVWKKRINKKMNEEGYECGWCIKEPENWNDYSKDGYLYVEKNGKPWLVADNHSGECKDYQDSANPENIKPCAYLLYKNGLDFSKDFKPSYLYEDEYTPEKIKNEFWEKALEDSDYAFYLLLDKTITRSDGGIYNKVVEKAIGYSRNAYRLLENKTITKEEDGEIFRKAVEKAIEDLDNAYWLLSDKTITKSDGEIFKKVLEKAIKDSENAYNLLDNKIIMKSDGETYNKAVEIAIESPLAAFWLLRDKIITKSDVSSELWEKVLVSAEKYNSDVRQKFASREYILGKFYKISRIHIYFEK